jgi:hypothetical protein
MTRSFFCRKYFSVCATTALVLPLLVLGACSSRNYTYYLIDLPVQKNPVLKEQGTPLRPYAFGSATVMKVRWNDGQVFTEVDVPLFASGQRVVVDHSAGNEQIKAIPMTKIVPPPPSSADKSLVDAYRERGLKVVESAPEVSISRAKSLLQSALKSGNYSMALEYAEVVLSRYPSHPEFLRAKGSILLLMGEKEKAIEIWEQSEEIESDPGVRKKLEELQKQKK